MDFSSLITLVVNGAGWVLVAFVLRTVWTLILDQEALVLPWQGFRRMLGDWRGFVLVAATFAFAQTTGSAANAMNAWTGFPPAWWQGLLIAVVAGAAMILALEALKALWEGGGGFRMVGDWLRNPIKRVPEFLATVLGSFVVIWAGATALSMIPPLAGSMSGVTSGGIVPWPEMSAAIWGPGILGLLLFGLPAVLAIIMAQGENEAPVASCVAVFKRWWGIAQRWQLNLSWLVGMALLGMVWDGLRGWIDGLGASGMVADLLSVAVTVLGIAVAGGIVMSLYGLRDAHRANKMG